MAKKDAYFFPHFSNARHDRKVKRIIKELGVEGYGIYFMLLEILREQTDLRYPMTDIDLLADEFNTSEQKVRTVICNYKLFDVDENENFFSLKLIYYLQPYFEKSERARVAANKRWENAKIQAKDANAYANALPEHSDGKPNAMQRENTKEYKSIRKEYPGTMVAKVAKAKLPKLIDKYGYDQMLRTVERYKTYVLSQRKDGFKELKYMNESTFWNGRYEDFLDEAYNEVVIVAEELPEPPKQKSLLEQVRERDNGSN